MCSVYLTLKVWVSNRIGGAAFIFLKFPVRHFDLPLLEDLTNSLSAKLNICVRLGASAYCVCAGGEGKGGWGRAPGGGGNEVRGDPELARTACCLHLQNARATAAAAACGLPPGAGIIIVVSSWPVERAPNDTSTISPTLSSLLRAEWQASTFLPHSSATYPPPCSPRDDDNIVDTYQTQN